jgi:hypothetical protein
MHVGECALLCFQMQALEKAAYSLVLVRWDMPRGARLHACVAGRPLPELEPEEPVRPGKREGYIELVEVFLRSGEIVPVTIALDVPGRRRSRSSFASFAQYRAGLDFPLGGVTYEVRPHQK